MCVQPYICLNSACIPFLRGRSINIPRIPLLRAARECSEYVELALRGTLRVTQHAAGLYYFPFGSLKHNYILTSSQP